LAIHEHGGKMPKIAKAAFVAPNASLIGDVELDEGSSVWFGAVLRGDLNRIYVGKRSNLQDLVAVHVTRELPVIVEEDVTVGHSAILHGCIVRRGSLIGMGAVVLDGAEIGEFSIVGAKALVTGGKRFPPRSLIIGAPAKVVRELTEEELKHLKEHVLAYEELARSYGL